MFVSTFTGSIVDPALGAHVIVNASNPGVELGSGVSGAIRDACGGAAFQANLKEAWDDEFGEPMTPDDCLVTSGGTAAHIRWVLHVPAVDYKHRDPETGRATGPTRVTTCTRSLLREAAQLAHEHDLQQELVVGVVLLGAGAGGLGEVDSADAMMSAIRAACEAGSPIKELRFAVLKNESARVVLLAARHHGVPVRE